MSFNADGLATPFYAQERNAAQLDGLFKAASLFRRLPKRL
jgi:hypothetical protein